MQLVIDRKQWLRGEGAEESYLLRRTDHKMCCLGFYALGCGFTKEQIIDADTPAALMESPTATVPEWLVEVKPSTSPATYVHRIHSTDCRLLMETNDDDEMSDAAREKVIKETFAKHGVEVVFTN